MTYLLGASACVGKSLYVLRRQSLFEGRRRRIAPWLPRVSDPDGDEPLTLRPRQT